MLTESGNEVFFHSDGGEIANEASKREIHFRKSDGVYVLGVLTAPARGANSLAQSAGADGNGEWTQAQSRGAAQRGRQPQKSARADVSVAS
eukprot:10921096-Alexandrium_andersonii.AAC.1